MMHLHAETGGATTALAPLTVREYRDADAQRWDAFVQACPEATFFHLSGWKGIIERIFRHRTRYLLAERGDRIVGVLPIAQVKSRLFGHAITSLPFGRVRWMCRR